MIQDLIRKKLHDVGIQELPPSLLTPEVLPPRELPQGEMAGELAPAPVVDNAPALVQPVVTNDISSRARIAEPVPTVPVPVNDTRTLSQQLADKIAEIDNKDYSKAERDSQGNLIKPAGKDRKKKWSTAEKIGNAALGFLQGGVPGAVIASTDRNYFKKLKDAVKRAELVPQFQEAAAREQFQTQQADAVARRDNLKRDDAIKVVQLQQQEEIAKDRLRTQALNKVTSLKYYDPKNTAHQKLAETAGLDAEALKGWDDRNPITKIVAGTTYKYNRENGAFEPSNLPVDEAKTVVDYEVEMPGGEKRKYRVAQKDAASFSTQMTALGARLEQQESQFQRTLDYRTQRDALDRSAEKEMVEYKAAIKAQQDAADDAQRQAAQIRAEESKKRLMKLQSELDILEKQ